MKNKKITFKMHLLALPLMLCVAPLKSQIPDCVPKNGLVLYMPFNDSAKDVSGNGNNGKPFNVSYIQDRFGNKNAAFRFDRNIPSYIEIPNSASLNHGDATYNLWFNSNFTGVTLLSKTGFEDATEEGMRIELHSHNIVTAVKYQSNCIPGTGWATNNNPLTYNDFKWHMVTLVYGDTQSKLYFDGVLQNTIKTPTSRADSCPGNIQIGRYWKLGARYYTGDLDDIAIWNRALSPSEIKDLFHSGGDQLVEREVSIRPGGAFTFNSKTYTTSGTYYDTIRLNMNGVCKRIFKINVKEVPISTKLPLDDLVMFLPFTDSAKDVSGYNNHGKPYRVQYTRDRWGNPNSAFEFIDSNQSHIEVPNSSSLNHGIGTYNIWFKTKNSGPRRTLLTKTTFANAANEAINIHLQRNKYVTGAKFNNNCNLANWKENGVNWNYDDENWHMITLVYGDSQIINYYDGQLHGVVKGSVPRADSCSGDIQIGRHWLGDPRYFNGAMDDVSIWKTMLTAEDVKLLYSSQEFLSNSKPKAKPNYFAIYPNPNQGSFSFNIGDKQLYNLVVFNMQGKTVFSQNEVSNQSTISLNQPAGMYLIQLSSSAGQVYHSRFIIE